MQKQKFGPVLPIILISYFMILLDNSIVFTSTVKIAQDLQMDAQALAWVTNAYALTFGGLLMLGGKAGDILGRRRVFTFGLVIFTLGSLLVGLAQNGAMIIAMRALQGIGSAILAPTTLALLMDSYQGNMRTKAIAYYGATAGIGASFGLVVGGLHCQLPDLAGRLLAQRAGGNHVAGAHHHLRAGASGSGRPVGLVGGHYLSDRFCMPHLQH